LIKDKKWYAVPTFFKFLITNDNSLNYVGCLIYMFTIVYYFDILQHFVIRKRS